MAFGDEVREFVSSSWSSLGDTLGFGETADSCEEIPRKPAEKCVVLDDDVVSGVVDGQPASDVPVDVAPARAAPVARKHRAAKPVVVNIGSDGLVDSKHVETDHSVAQTSSSAPLNNVQNFASVPPPQGFQYYAPYQQNGFPSPYGYGYPGFQNCGFPAQMYPPFTMGTVSPGQSAPQLPSAPQLTPSQCGPRVMTEAELSAKYPKAKTTINQPVVSDKLTPLQQIAMREKEKGLDLSADYIVRHRKKLATVRETIRRLKQLLPQCEAKFNLWTSLQDDWDWANDLRGEKKFAEEMDISLKPPAKKQKIDPELKKKADAFVKGPGKDGMEVESESENSGAEGQ
jgi:hypothetical protein